MSTHLKVFALLAILVYCLGLEVQQKGKNCVSIFLRLPVCACFF